VAAYKQDVDLMHTPSLLQDTPSFKLKNPSPRSLHTYQSPQLMQSQHFQYTPPPYHNNTLFATPHTPQGPLGSPIPSSPNSHTYTSRGEIPPSSQSSPPLSPPPPPGTTYYHQSPPYFTAHGTFNNNAFENSPVKQQHQPALVR
jgi:hypothetical protein